MILFLAANPAGTSELALGKECAAIESELERTPGRDEFELRSKWAVTVDELMRHLASLRPTILHFSGHGEPHSHLVHIGRSHRAHRDIEAGADGGIYLQDEQGQPQHVPKRALKQIIESAGASLRLVVLNACFSDAVAEELRDAVDCVIGMCGPVVDDAARAFAVGFYRALGHGEPVGKAYAQARATLAGKGLDAQAEPRYIARPGVDVDTLLLGGRAPQGAASNAQSLTSPADGATAPADPVAAWLQFGLEHHGRVMVAGFRAASIPIDLDQVFVPLSVYADRNRKGIGPDGPGDKDRRGLGGAEMSLDEALARANNGRTCLALIGDPGAGKTTLLRYLFRRVARGEMGGPLAHWRGLHPVLVRLATITDDERVSRGLERIIRRVAAKDGYPAAGPAILTRQGKGFLFLLDGFDEVREARTREQICEWLNEEIDHWRTCAFVVTSRRTAWDRTPALSARFLPVSVQGLHQDARDDYVRSWFHAIVRHFAGAVDSPEEIQARAREKAATLLDVLATPAWRDSTRLKMTTNPLMLSSLCIAHYNDARLPERRGKLYEGLGGAGTAAALLIIIMLAASDMKNVPEVKAASLEGVGATAALAWFGQWLVRFGGWLVPRTAVASVAGELQRLFELAQSYDSPELAERALLILASEDPVLRAAARALVGLPDAEAGAPREG